MTRRQGAARGVLTALLCAGPLSGLAVLDMDPSANVLFVVVGIPVIASAIGAGYGGLAAGLRGREARRIVISLLLVPVGPWLAAMAVLLLLIGATDRELLVRVPGTAARMVLMVAPYLLPPVILGHLIVEGWTRPIDVTPSGFARPIVRRVVFHLLVMAGAALGSAAALHRTR